LAARIVEGLFAAFLVAIGAYLAFYGWQLISLNGSWYYLVTGVVMLAVAVLLVLRNPWGPRAYAVWLLATVLWALWEAGLDFIPLLSRLGAPMAVGLWFLMPWHRAAMRRTEDEAPVRGIMAPGGGLAVGVGLLAGALALTVGGMQRYKVEPWEPAQPAPQAATVVDWRNYGNSTKGQRFSELTQINAENAGDLKEVWRFRTGVPYDFKLTPLQVGELVYVCTAGNVVIAIDAETGEERWRHDTRTVAPGSQRGGLASASTFARTCRGLGYHEAAADYAGPCAKRIITNTTDARLLAIDALTGLTCPGFGFDGEVNLKSGLGDQSVGEYMVTSAPLIAGNVAVLGGWVADNQEMGQVSGVLRAYDVMTGQFVWAWDMGNPGYNGLPDEGGEYTRGTPNIWSNTSYDPDLNLVFAPTGNPGPDYFGGKRREFDEKYSSSVVALDAATGQVRWSYQTVHHDIWDWDVPSQPTLLDITKDGQRIPVVVQPTKRGEVFVLDRRDGTPVWPATTCPDGSPAAPGGECKVPQDPVEGDFVTATQPFSGLPHFRPDRLEKDMWGITPLDHLYCRIEYKKMRYDGHFTPPTRGGGGGATGKPTWGGTFQFPGNAGGFNWPSVAVDPDNGLLIAQPMIMGNRIVMVTPEERTGMMRAMMAQRQEEEARKARRAGQDADDHAGPAAPGPAAPGPSGQAPRPGASGPAAGGQGASGGPRPQSPGRKPYTAQGEWSPETARYGLTEPFISEWEIPFTGIKADIPCYEPPYGRLAVIDLNTGKQLWSRAIGTMDEIGPFGIKTGLPFQVGTPIYGGVMTTRGGVIFQVGSMDSTMRAVDVRTGKILWSAELPGTANGTPITYLSQKSGRQMVVVPVPNPGFIYPRDGAAEPTDSQGGYVIAYALKSAGAQ
jgi:membrane-bound PQQ-dependent dehydrogenase (glucose/quinate/shikimate family)